MRLRRLTDLPIMIPWILCAGFALFAFLRWRPTPAPILKPATVERYDSLRSAAVLDQKARDALKADAALALDSARSAVARARAASNAAARSKTRADTLARSAARSDSSATEWKLAYLARTEEADSLWSSSRQYEIALGEETRARRSAEGVAQNAEVRLRAVERLNMDMAHQVRVYAERQDKLFGRIPLPSRKVAAIGGVLVGSIAVLAIR